MQIIKKTLEERFKERIDLRRAEREQREANTAEHRARMRAINEAPPRTRMGFWCEQCRRDYNLIGYKHRTDKAFDVDNGVMKFVYAERPIAWYSAMCPKRHELRRLITDKHRDPYYRLSRSVAFERSMLEDDLLQPSDPRFKYVYPEAWKKLQAQQQEANDKISFTGEATV